jgi:hypothetical protein
MVKNQLFPTNWDIRTAAEERIALLESEDEGKPLVRAQPQAKNRIAERAI